MNTQLRFLLEYSYTHVQNMREKKTVLGPLMNYFRAQDVVALDGTRQNEAYNGVVDRSSVLPEPLQETGVYWTENN